MIYIAAVAKSPDGNRHNVQVGKGAKYVSEALDIVENFRFTFLYTKGKREPIFILSTAASFIKAMKYWKKIRIE